MSKKKVLSSNVDQFPNMYRCQTIEAVAATPYYLTWPTGFTIKDGYAYVVHQVKYRILPAYLDLLIAAGDSIYAGLSTNNQLAVATIQQNVNSALIDTLCIDYHVSTAVGAQIMETLWVHDFTNEPGGGRIIAPNPLYTYTFGVSIAAVVTVNFEVVYTTIKINDKLYRELWESMNPTA